MNKISKPVPTYAEFPGKCMCSLCRIHGDKSPHRIEDALKNDRHKSPHPVFFAEKPKAESLWLRVARWLVQ